MYSSPANRSANAYAQHGASVQAAAASPHELIAILFDAIDAELLSAIGALQTGETERRGKAVNKAILLLQDGLRGGLDLQNGGELAQRLDKLYEFCIGQLSLAHTQREHKLFEEVREHLRTVAESWKAIRPAG